MGQLTIGDRLRRAIQRSGLSQRLVAERAGITAEALTHILQGRVRNPRFLTVAAIVEAIGITWADLFDEPRLQFSNADDRVIDDFLDVLARARRNDRVQKELREDVSRDVVRDDPLDDVAQLPNVEIPEEVLRQGARHVYRVETDSMIGVGIHIGSIIYVRRSADLAAADGSIVIVRLNGARYLKRLDHRGKRTVLRSENPRYAALNVRASDKFDLIGVVVDER